MVDIFDFFDHLHEHLVILGAGVATLVLEVDVFVDHLASEIGVDSEGGLEVVFVVHGGALRNHHLSAFVDSSYLHYLVPLHAEIAD